jgi:hypothetical protein
MRVSDEATLKYRIMVHNFKKLLNESYEGRFVVEPNETTEIHVDYGRAEITVLTFRTKNQVAPETKKTYTSLAGMFGKPTVEQKFNEIIKEFKINNSIKKDNAVKNLDKIYAKYKLAISTLERENVSLDAKLQRESTDLKQEKVIIRKIKSNNKKVALLNTQKEKELDKYYDQKRINDLLK